MPQSNRIVFLYTELAGYFIACVNELSRQFDGEIHIIRWQVNNEAPFNFTNSNPNIIFYDRNKFTNNQLVDLVEGLQPKLIYCSGWIDKGYISICKKWKNKIPVLGGMDTQWTGSFKQYLRVVMAPFQVRKYFSHLWVAGDLQKKYAQKLGFKKSEIISGVYSADVDFYNQLYASSFPAKEIAFPKKFVFVGRYLEFKGIHDLWEAFIQSLNETNHDWDLICLGVGDLWENRMQHPRIKHLGFVQPHEMEKVIEQTGVFILPSRFEPWAVALHEFCAAGYPVICSNRVGAAGEFLEVGKNGYTFNSGNVAELKNQLLKITQLTQEQLVEMAIHSHNLAQKITPKTWVGHILNLI